MCRYEDIDDNTVASPKRPLAVVPWTVAMYPTTRCLGTCPQSRGRRLDWDVRLIGTSG